MIVYDALSKLTGKPSLTGLSVCHVAYDHDLFCQPTAAWAFDYSGFDPAKLKLLSALDVTIYIDDEELRNPARGNMTPEQFAKARAGAMRHIRACNTSARIGFYGHQAPTENVGVYDLVGFVALDCYAYTDPIPPFRITRPPTDKPLHLFLDWRYCGGPKKGQFIPLAAWEVLCRWARTEADAVVVWDPEPGQWSSKEISERFAVVQRVLLPRLGDLNNDGVVNGLDIPLIRLALKDPIKFQEQTGLDPAIVADANQDGRFNSLDIPGLKEQLLK